MNKSYDILNLLYKLRKKLEHFSEKKNYLIHFKDFKHFLYFKKMKKRLKKERNYKITYCFINQCIEEITQIPYGLNKHLA